MFAKKDELDSDDEGDFLDEMEFYPLDDEQGEEENDSREELRRSSHDKLRRSCDADLESRAENIVHEAHNDDSSCPIPSHHNLMPTHHHDMSSQHSQIHQISGILLKILAQVRIETRCPMFSIFSGSIKMILGTMSINQAPPVLSSLSKKDQDASRSAGMKSLRAIALLGAGVALLGAGVSGLLSFTTIASADEAEHGLECPSYPWPHQGILSSSGKVVTDFDGRRQWIGGEDILR
ncbi:cytochrome c1 [Artemisia annua]|uniref:Cytochrome c1 n=1 Tax=Artemisia annua TaxID=35608 RepID=A0A2U1NY84_ARTAN|nr:cytochrome c1 [Artemisia annua]